ncbi:MAG TPA: TRAP transporter small permease [Xanthobacteraceae bacterium]|uniref:TRAP transporter small permease n=1 Tax=Roseixanthobacter finlandensis TaxID=3119922 RepID=UPI002699C50D|nr:TRAP transporter small permease [Xanthobacteraceae bacterium]HQS45442.1 TRAP transporter small permease [Xanthobacteraceae bacterium]
MSDPPAAEGASAEAPLNGDVSSPVGLLAEVIIVSAGLAAVLIALAVCYEVFMRSVLGRSVIWVEEISAYLIGYIVFIGMGAALYQSAHVEVDFVLALLGRRAAMLLRLGSNLVLLLLSGTMVWLSWEFWLDTWVSGERSISMLSVPLWIPYLAFFAGSVLLLVFAVLRLLVLAQLVRSEYGSPNSEASP